MEDEMDPKRATEIKGRTNEEAIIDTLDEEEFEAIDDDNEVADEEDLEA